MSKSKLLTSEARRNSKVSKRVNHLKKLYKNQVKKTILLKFHIHNFWKLIDKLKAENRITNEEIKQIILPLKAVREMEEFKK